LVVARQVLVLIDRGRLEQRLVFQGLHDPLTGLANRALLHSHIEQALARRRRDGSDAAVLFIDLDDFKAVNDTLGHGAGDELLCEVARRLAAVCRESDLIARTGGDEFAVLLHPASVESIAATAARLLGSLRRSHVARDRVVSVSASIGAATLADDDREAGHVLARADIAMYAAKRAGKATVRVFEPFMQFEVEERLNLLEDLRSAIERDEFVLYFQPIVRLRTQDIVGLEALLRWYHPTRGLLSPAVFMPYVEESGLIVPIGAWVLRAATAAAAKWDRAHCLQAPLMLSVNVSVMQLQGESFVQDVRRALDASGLPPEQLVLEVTETTLIAEPEVVARVLSELREDGIRVAIDDFGAGFSSLSHLTRLPVDVLKIDQSFIQLLDSRSEDSELVAAMCKIGRTLGFQVVAEGIETSSQLHQLDRMGCDYGQGYLLGYPAPGHDVDDLLAKVTSARPA
jgi:diguanylate cyclase (GGDEF)-like protein